MHLSARTTSLRRGLGRFACASLNPRSACGAQTCEPPLNFVPWTGKLWPRAQGFHPRGGPRVHDADDWLWRCHHTVQALDGLGDTVPHRPRAAGRAGGRPTSPARLLLRVLLACRAFEGCDCADGAASAVLRLTQHRRAAHHPGSADAAVPDRADPDGQVRGAAFEDPLRAGRARLLQALLHLLTTLIHHNHLRLRPHHRHPSPHPRAPCAAPPGRASRPLRAPPRQRGRPALPVQERIRHDGAAARRGARRHGPPARARRARVGGAAGAALLPVRHRPALRRVPLPPPSLLLPLPMSLLYSCRHPPPAARAAALGAARALTRREASTRRARAASRRSPPARARQRGVHVPDVVPAQVGAPVLRTKIPDRNYLEVRTKRPVSSRAPGFARPP